MIFTCPLPSRFKFDIYMNYGCHQHSIIDLIQEEQDKLAPYLIWCGVINLPSLH